MATALAAPIAADARPSAAVEDSAIRLVRAGWISYLTGYAHDETGYHFTVPSETIDGTYTVDFDPDRRELRCTCMAGQRSQHCKHITLVQFVTGTCAAWPAPEPIRRPTPGTSPRTQSRVQADATEAVERAHPSSPFSIDERVLAQLSSAELIPAGTSKTLWFGRTGYGVLASKWDAMAAALGTDHAHTALTAAIAATAADRYHCALCHHELRPFGSRGDASACFTCGLIIPMPQRAEAGA